MDSFDKFLYVFSMLLIALGVLMLLYYSLMSTNSLIKVVNKNKKPTANSDYWFVMLTRNGVKEPYLFTDSQLKDARERALNNREDYEK